MSDSEWIGVREAARLLEVSEATVYRSLKEPSTADTKWGPDNWRRKPLSDRGDFQVRRSRVEEIKRGEA